MVLLEQILALLLVSPAPVAALEASPRWAPVDEGGVIELRSPEAVGVSPCERGFDCGNSREVWIDFAAVGVAEPGGTWLRYDYNEVTRPVQVRDFPYESELSLAVRLIVSEVGADRLLMNRYAVGEAIGILYTVDNRLDPLVYNVVDEPAAPVFPGCGVSGAFWSCANGQQYLGMATWRAMDPASRYPADLLEPAVDLAVIAWWLEHERLIDDFTDGATNYVHRCGGAAYGLPTYRCDAHIGNTARDDVAGANPYTGPILFRGPSVWSARRGVYEIDEVRRLEYDAWWRVTAWVDLGDALADASEESDERDLALGAEIVSDGVALASEMAATDQIAALATGLGPPVDRAALDPLIFGIKRR